MKSYEDLGFGPRMVKTTSLAGTRQYTNALEDNLKVESTPYLNRTAISKGTVQTNLGGLLELYDKTGGTKVMSYDPATGIVTILGSLVAEQVNSGTYTTIVIAGNSSLVGTLSGGVHGTSLYQGGTLANAIVGTPSTQGGTVGTAQIIGGTINPSVYQIGGTVGATGSIVYVKTVDFVGSAVTLGTVNFNNGIIFNAN